MSLAGLLLVVLLFVNCCFPFVVCFVNLSVERQALPAVDYDYSLLFRSLLIVVFRLSCPSFVNLF